MEGVFFILVFMGVIAITALLFGVWVIVGIVRIMGRIIGTIFGTPRRPPMPITRALPSVRCPNDRCHAMNPVNARFCRRCGQAIDVQRVASRRAAMWCW